MSNPSYSYRVEKEQKKVVFQKKNDDGSPGETGLMMHRASFITISLQREGFPQEDCVTFKITKKGNHYDSRDNHGKMVKAVAPEFVQAELKRILGDDRGEAAYAEANGFKANQAEIEKARASHKAANALLKAQEKAKSEQPKLTQEEALALATKLVREGLAVAAA